VTNVILAISEGKDGTLFTEHKKEKIFEPTKDFFGLSQNSRHMPKFLHSNRNLEIAIEILPEKHIDFWYKAKVDIYNRLELINVYDACTKGKLKKQ
jgi:hypothetical protein